MKPRTLIPLAAAALTLTACHHKDLEYEAHTRGDVQVVFDWRNAPDARPNSMLAYFYPAAGGDALLYTFADRTGGPVSIPFGLYAGIGINGDNTDWASMRRTDDPDAFEVYTRDAVSLQAAAAPTRALPRAQGAEDERMALTPGMVWSHRIGQVNIDPDIDGTQTVTFYPEETVCHYTVDILDIEHPEYLHGAQLDATLSGMAEGYLQGRRQATDVAVTMPFTLKPDAADSDLHAEFLTFGECATTAHKHYLTAYAVLSDGTKWYHTYDVTSQVTDAPDPKHVHIIVRGLDLPEPTTGGGGFRPDVNDWNDININLPM